MNNVNNVNVNRNVNVEGGCCNRRLGQRLSPGCDSGGGGRCGCRDVRCGRLDGGGAPAGLRAGELRWHGLPAVRKHLVSAPGDAVRCSSTRQTESLPGDSSPAVARFGAAIGGPAQSLRCCGVRTTRGRHRMHSPIQTFLAELHGELAGTRRGEVATYIPELAKADPGVRPLPRPPSTVISTRRASWPAFTIQSVSKPFVYALALADRGADAVLARSGSSRPATRSTRSASTRDRAPLNPMVNAGAIVTTGAGRRRRPGSSGTALRLSAALPGAPSPSTRRSTGRRARPATATARSPGC